MSNIFIILAGGTNKRLNSKIPKPYIKINNKELIEYSINIAKNVKEIDKIAIVYNKKHLKFLKNKKFNNILKIEGGKTRSESSYNALKKIKKYNFKNVLIHDAARPNLSINLVKKIILNLKNNSNSIPVLKITDSIKEKKNKKIYNLNRNNLFITQTPQGFRFIDLYNLNKNKFNKKDTDDSSLFSENGEKINFIKGEQNNFKITNNNDLDIFIKLKKRTTNYGIGFDIHRLVNKKKLYLGGIKIPSPFGILGHSDGDPVLHAVIDAILGACSLGDIGEKFSNQNKKFKNIRSTILLKKIIEETETKGFKINNIDINIIAQKPKIQKYKGMIINCIAKLCQILPSQINIKGKTTEKLGLIGKEKAIACEVIASVIKYD